MSTCTKETLTEVVARYGGIKSGSHDVDDGACCILEAISVCDGREWTDSFIALDRPDVRPLNDAAWPNDATRTEQMLRLAPLLEEWPHWSLARRKAWARRVALRTVREVLPIALRAAQIDNATIAACEQANGLEAEMAARAASNTANDFASAAAWDSKCAESDAAKSAVWAGAWAAIACALAESDPASAAGAAAGSAAVADVLVPAVTIWVDESEREVSL